MRPEVRWVPILQRHRAAERHFWPGNEDIYLGDVGARIVRRGGVPAAVDARFHLAIHEALRPLRLTKNDYEGCLCRKAASKPSLVRSAGAGSVHLCAG
jgi:hypothetical protein